MDLDPFVPAGIAAPTLRFLDIFLLHCLLQDSPPDTPDEIAALGRNQHHTATHGREPGVKLERNGRDIALADWAEEILAECAPIAAALDAAHGGSDHAQALAGAHSALAAPERLPSARVLAVMQRDFQGSHIGFIGAQAEQTRRHLLDLPFGVADQAAFEAEAAASVDRRRAIEAADTQDFESFRQAYVADSGLRFND